MLELEDVVFAIGGLVMYMLELSSDVDVLAIGGLLLLFSGSSVDVPCCDCALFWGASGMTILPHCVHGSSPRSSL
jgi:hypothetical protein